MADHTPSAAGVEDVRLVGSHRVLAILTKLAEHAEGVTLDEMAQMVASPKSTVHRCLAALRDMHFAAQDGRGRYLLGAEFLRLAFAYQEARPDDVRVRPILEWLAGEFSETVHYAVLHDREVIYRSKVDPPSGAVKLTSTIGGRNPAYSTAVGKVLLAFSLPDDAAVRAWVGDRVLQRRTEHTITDVRRLCDELRLVRERGFAVDDQENELGINCVAVPTFLTSPSIPSGAISVSALAYRTPLKTLVGAVDRIRAIIAAG